MIAASRRRRSQRGDAFRLHEALAARTGLSVRLRRGAVAALVASAGALLLGAGLQQHLLAVALALAIVAALPVRGTKAEALAFIRGRAGLSYETALGVLDDPGEDEFGLRSSVVERARLAVRDVRPEPAPAWWLPALAVALGLTLFSLDGPLGRTGGGAGQGGSPLASDPVPPAPEAAAPAEEQDADVAAPPEATPDRAAEDPDSQTRDEDDRADGASAAPPGGDGSAAAPLDRFLDSLRERPESAEPPDQPGAPAQGGEQPPRAEGPASPSEGQGQQPERVELQQQGAAPEDEGGEGQQQGAEGQGQPGEEGEDGAAGDQPGQQEGAGGEQGGQEEGEGQPQPSDQPGGEGGAMPEAGGDQGEGQGEDSTRGLMPDDGSQSPDPDEAAGAGAGGGAKDEAGAAAGESGETEVLPGVLQDGPENPAGTVRLPGDTEVFLPPGRAPADYTEAAEEALSEGDLPLAYQEVIRRYFR